MAAKHARRVTIDKQNESNRLTKEIREVLVAPGPPRPNGLGGPGAHSDIHHRILCEEASRDEQAMFQTEVYPWLLLGVFQLGTHA